MANRKFLFLLLAYSLLALCAGVGETYAKTIYVATNGSDANPGTLSQPLATPERALDMAQPGDVIQLRGGTYRVTERLYVGKANLAMMSYPGERATLQATPDGGGRYPDPIIYIDHTDAFRLENLKMVAPSDRETEKIIHIDSTSNVTMLNLEVQGGSYYGIKIDAREDPPVGSTKNIKIQACYVHHTGRDAIKTFNSDNLLIEDCEIGPTGLRESNAEGIDCIGSIGVIIRRNYIHNTASSGVYLKGGARDGLIERCRIVNAGNSGLLFGQDTDPYYMRDGTRYEAINCIARNNVIVNTTGAGIGTYSGDNVRFYHNTLIDVARVNHAGFYVVMNNADQPSRRVQFKNNIVVVNSQRPMAVIITLADQLISDNNIWFRPTGGAYKFTREHWQGTERYDYWQSLADWQANMNADRNSRAIDPRLNAASLYSLLSGSPAIDRGETLADVREDFSGKARPQGAAPDIGAFEQGGSDAPPPPPPPAPANKPPVVTLSATPTSGTIPLAVKFTAAASDPDGQVVGYKWDFGNGQSSTATGPSHTYQSAGSFTAQVTVTDNAGATARASIVINVTGGTGTSVGDVTWRNTVGVTVARNSITKTASAAWGNAGASSVQSLASGNGYLQFTAAETDNERMCGLSNSDPDQHYKSIAYAIHLNTGRAFYVVESGVSRGYFGDYNSGDVFRVAVESGAVRYYRNGQVFYTSKVAPQYPLVADAALLGPGATITNAVLSGESKRGPIPVSMIEVEVLTPTTGETLKAGSVYNIEWGIRGVGIWRQDIEISYDGGVSWQDVAVMLPGSATAYSWKVPNKKNKRARIRITSYGGGELRGEGVSQGDFLISKGKSQSKKQGK